MSLSADNNESSQKSLKTIMKLFLVIFLISAGLVVSAVIFLALAQLLHKGFNEKGLLAVGKFLQRLEADPLYLWEAYSQWSESFVKAWHKGVLNAAVMVPLISPLLFVLLTIWIFIKSSYSFRLWYKLNNRFADLEDIKKMGLFDGHLMALGRFGDRILKLKRCASVLCFGETGSGKTVGVAIPSILESDNACIVAVDSCNELAKYTSGYRATLGKVFYFNWNLTDEPLNNVFYPRWNPLSGKDMPGKGEEREKYVSGLSRYFIAYNRNDDTDNDNYWEKLAMAAMDGILNFFIAKIERASANDYFLSEMLDKGRLSKEDKDLLLSYYVLMNKKYSLAAIKNIELNKLEMNNYLPVGSWEGIPKLWQGKEMNFAMFSDWLLQSYFAVKAAANNQDADGWKIVIERWIEEAKFFGYNEKALETLEKLFYLSRKQRSIIFPMVINPLSVFRNASVRERTSTSDFYMYQSRGIKNPESGNWEVVTIYSISGNKAVDFINKLFIDLLVDNNIVPQKGYGPFPLLFVMDDIEQQPRYNSLIEGLIHGSHSRMVFLLCSDYVKMMQEKYTTEGMEEIVSNAVYKLMLSDSYKTLAWKFENLAVYGTKSVQIPAGDVGSYLKAKSGLTDASYYKIIAKNLNSIKKNDLEIGDELLAAAGFYHLPIKLKCLYFLQNEELKAKATYDAYYFLDEELEKKRNVQDIETPGMIDVLHETGLDLKTAEDINIFLEDKYEEAVERRQVVADKQSALADDISSRWKSRPHVHRPQTGSEWWLDEDAFSLEGNDGEENNNPFK